MKMRVAIEGITKRCLVDDGDKEADISHLVKDINFGKNKKGWPTIILKLSKRSIEFNPINKFEAMYTIADGEDKKVLERELYGTNASDES